MQLKRLQLLGFKTFADKTEIEIDRGMTAVVGPNGSGKSNIVDALLWVLGEQNPRILRGLSAQDVIFAGSERRKPLGMAEVRLTIDNADASLPIGFAEVTVTRRVYRSGESQYLLNGAHCRLKDIIELFLDTGAGKGAYAFVSQSEIDAVLSARPEDRRELFEEAAGIKRYRVKKREALRKLEAAEANIARVRDILFELESQREPMEQQAEQARRCMLLQKRLHEIEVGLLVAELQKADYELEATRCERDEDSDELLRLDAEIARLDRAAAAAAERMHEIDRELEGARSAHVAALSLVERSESRLALCRERAASAEQSEARLEREIAELAGSAAHTAAQIATAEQELEAAERAETDGRAQWASEQASLRNIEAGLTAVVRSGEERRAERARLAAERAGREAALDAARQRLEDARTRIRGLSQDSAALDGALGAAREEEARAAAAAIECMAARDALSARRADLAVRRQALISEQTSLREMLDGLRRRHAECSSRLNTLVELQNSHDGFYQGVRAVLNARREGKLTGHYIPVVDLLKVPEEYRVAVEVSLGGSLQDVVVETESEAKAAIEWLKRSRAGRATFLPLPLLHPGRPLTDSDMRGALSGLPVCGVAADLVEYDASYRAAVQLLLGRVLIVADIDAALAASKRLSGWSRIVTLQGELLTPGGAVTGGSLQGKGAHLVGRKGEMDDLQARLPQIDGDIQARSAELASQARALEQVEQERGGAESAAAATQTELAAASAAQAAAEREIARLLREREDRSVLLRRLESQAGELEREIARLAAAVVTSLESDETADDRLAEIGEETRALAARRDMVRAAAVGLEVEVGRLAEKRSGLARAVSAARLSIAETERQAASRRAAQGAAHHDGADADAEIARLEAHRERARQELDRGQAELDTLREQRQAFAVEMAREGGQAREAAQARTALTQGLHAAELRIARLEMQLAQIAERLEDEYSISRQEALARPDDTPVDRNTVTEIGRLRREIRGMGQVNTGAVTEFERLTERYEFLTAQQADLERSRETVLATIAEIDESTRDVFAETFRAVKTEFQRLFTRLFEGGSTDLKLTDPDDVLETGIEVIAQPPGKKPQSLSLLSGGERALTAVALLFAFLAVRPSPFVLLDEVDAPLDGANVEKFTHLVREFSERSQFLIITHNPATMEAAPTWYGVTMREPGVSTVLSYRVPEAAADVREPELVVLSA